jgi:hypothetical protein
MGQRNFSDIKTLLVDIAQHTQEQNARRLETSEQLQQLKGRYETLWGANTPRLNTRREISLLDKEWEARRKELYSLGTSIKEDRRQLRQLRVRVILAWPYFALRWIIQNLGHLLGGRKRH